MCTVSFVTKFTSVNSLICLLSCHCCLLDHSCVVVFHHFVSTVTTVPLLTTVSAITLSILSLSAAAVSVATVSSLSPLNITCHCCDYHLICFCCCCILLVTAFSITSVVIVFVSYTIDASKACTELENAHRLLDTDRCMSIGSMYSR